MDLSVSSGKGDSESSKEGHSSSSKIEELNVLDIEQHSKRSYDTNGTIKEDVRATDRPEFRIASDEQAHLDTDDQEKVKMKSDPESEDEYEKNAHGEVFEDSPLSKSVDFMFETKYVMLNFMSLIPPDMYRGHISTSPEIEPELSQRYAKHNTHLSKSKSFDISSYHRKPKLKYIGKLRSIQKQMDSPASEDNLSYRYRKNLKPVESPGCDRFNSDPGTPPAVSELFEKSHSAHEFSTHSSPSLSPQKSFHSPQRLFSDASSCGELSYMSDADDEYEDHSNASSIFSSRSISSRDGFLDLRRPYRGVHILPTLQSQSEDKDEADGLFPHLTEGNADNGDLETLPEEVKDEIHKDKENGKDLGEDVPPDSADVEGRSRLKQTADRSKLKLNIPCESVQLDDILLSLHSELSSEIDDMESEFEEALHSARSRMSRSSNITPLTPQTEAARILARIGDEVKEQYGARLAAAVNQLTYEQINNLSYSQFRDIAQSVVTAEVPGWRQVALLMVFGQKIIWGAVQHGQRHFGNVIDYCAQFVAENAAEFIIKQGGWSSVMNFDPSSDAQSSAEFDTSPEMVVDYFTSHDVTQVESEKCIHDESEGTNNISPGFKEDKSENTEQILNDDPNLSPSHRLTVSNVVKPRYASSVGFEYTDVIEDMAGEEIGSDSETDVNLAFVQKDEVEANVEDTLHDDVEENGDEAVKSKDQLKDDSEKCHDRDSVKGTNILEKQRKEDIPGETVDGRICSDKYETTNDLNSKNVIDYAKADSYDKESVYVRQATPSLFDSAVDSLNEVKDVNGNTSDKRTESGLSIKVMSNDKHGIVSERNDIVGETGVTEDDIEIAEDKSNGILYLKINSDDSESLNNNASKYLPASDQFNKSQNTERIKDTINRVAGTNAQIDLEGGTEQLINDDELRNIGESNKNNNRQTSEEDVFIEVIDPHSYQDFQYESDGESTENESVEKEVVEDNEGLDIEEIDDVCKDTQGSERETIQESHMSENLKRIGFRVAALAFALLAVGISVRFSTLNR
ncbi:uncharacterized protein LOC132743889 [Ruditapes philippinarum]|uniref:uncharacterized protein LOC132743889 n=1 Tax=Ruditapes philippinarum TaxID=129788 RepID=UPI00295BB0B0|nr:uncharacterized protein LOC132743889 [Ruditapes philippinarum]